MHGSFSRSIYKNWDSPGIISGEIKVKVQNLDIKKITSIKDKGKSQKENTSQWKWQRKLSGFSIINT